MATKEPQDRKAEEAVIGAVLIDPGCYPKLKAILNPNDFYIDKHRWVWEAFKNIDARNQPVDYLTVCRELEDQGKLADMGGDAFITGLSNSNPTSLNCETHATRVKEQAARREIVRGLNDIATLAWNQKIPVSQAISRLNAIAQATTGDTDKRFIVRDAAYSLSPQNTLKYLLEGIIYERAIAVIYGDGGSKKTWSLLYLGACVASGCPWGDIDTHKANVLYIDEEIGDYDMHTRSGMCIRGALGDQDVQLHYVSYAGFHIDNPTDEAMVINLIREQQAGLVIFDALSEIMRGDENSKQEVQPVFEALRRISDKTGAALIIVHHTNKHEGFRGSTVIKNAPDILIKITSEENSNFIDFKIQKSRRAKTTRWTMHATWEDGDKFYLGHAEAKIKPEGLNKGETFLIQYLTENGNTEKIVLQDKFKAAKLGTPKACENCLQSLKDKNLITRVNPSKSNKVRAIYGLFTNSE